MVYIESRGNNAAFHFSAEEYIMHKVKNPVLMIWQADKCVMLGVNQIADAEIDINYAQETGTQIVRRSSGGGTIYTDMGTLLYTFIEPLSKTRSPQEIFTRTAKKAAAALKALGLPASAEGRNDIVLDGKKISGLAQYIKHGSICTHGSLLYDTNLDILEDILSPDDIKITSKALRSVRSRVTNIKEHIINPPKISYFKNQLKKQLLREYDFIENILSEYDYSRIKLIHDQKYGSNSWTFGRSPKFSFRNAKRFKNGGIEVFLDIEQGLVSSCAIRGDFLGVLPIRELENMFVGKTFDRESFVDSLEDVYLQHYFGDISIEEFLSVMFVH